MLSYLVSIRLKVLFRFMLRHLKFFYKAGDNSKRVFVKITFWVFNWHVKFNYFKVWKALSAQGFGSAMQRFQEWKVFRILHVWTKTIDNHGCGPLQVDWCQGCRSFYRQVSTGSLGVPKSPFLIEKASYCLYPRRIYVVHPQISFKISFPL